jgi:outer membrane lipoprotein-sorting protein
MSELHDQESEFSRLLGQAPFDDVPSEAHRDRLREQMLARFESGPVPGMSRLQRAIYQGREIMRRPIPRFVAAAAACLAVFCVWLLVPGQQSTAVAFNTFANAIVAAKSASFEMEVQIEGQGKQNLQSYYLAPGKVRNEMKGIVNICDLKNGKFVTLMEGMKRATIMNMKNMPSKMGKPQFNDFFVQARDLLSTHRDAEYDKFKPLGEKEIDGVRALGFRLDTPLQMMTLWGNPATGLPVRIETEWSGIPRTEVTMSNFKLDVDLKPELFDTAVPAGYKVNSFDVDASPPTEATLIEGLRMAANMNDGMFLDKIDTASMQALIIKNTLSRMKKDNTKDLTQEMMNNTMTVGRGLLFALQLPESADVHYAGKGVKLNEPDRPIFWYKPEGSNTYRVVYADLSVKDAQTAPQVEGAVRIERTGKAAERQKK